MTYAELTKKFGEWYRKQDYSARTCEAAFKAGYALAITEANDKAESLGSYMLGRD